MKAAGCRSVQVAGGVAWRWVTWHMRCMKAGKGNHRLRGTHRWGQGHI